MKCRCGKEIHPCSQFLDCVDCRNKISATSTPMKFLPRRYIVNFVNGSAEFNDDDTPPAEEYLSLLEHESILREALAKEHASFYAQVYKAKQLLEHACYCSPDLPNGEMMCEPCQAIALIEKAKDARKA